MSYAVIVRLDRSGATVFIHRDDSAPLDCEEGVRYRLVAQAEDHAEAVRVTELTRRRISDGVPLTACPTAMSEARTQSGKATRAAKACDLPA